MPIASPPRWRRRSFTRRRPVRKRRQRPRRRINRRYAKQLGERPLTVFLIPTTRDKLLTGLAEGRGDIAAGNLTATLERLKVVDFVAAEDRKPVRELIVTGPASPPLATLDDLSGKTVHVRKASSYYESVVALNVRLR